MPRFGRFEVRKFPVRSKSNSKYFFILISYLFFIEHGLYLMEKTDWFAKMEKFMMMDN